MPAAAPETILPVASLAAMRAAHSELMRRRHQIAEAEKFLPEIVDFLRRD